MIVGPVQRKCPDVVVVPVDKIAQRCKRATARRSKRRQVKAMPLPGHFRDTRNRILELSL